MEEKAEKQPQFFEEYNFEIFPNKNLKVALFENVANCAELKQRFLGPTAEVEMAAMDAENILSLYHLLISANLALHRSSVDKMITRNIYTEIIYNLSPSTNVSDSLKKIGAQDCTTKLLCAAFNPDDEKFQALLEQVQGSLRPAADLITINDVKAEKFKKIYKISPQELELSSLEDAVIQKIVTKNVV